MRNLQEYPIKPEEIVRAINSARQAFFESGNMGGIDGAVYSLLLDYFDNNPEVLDDIVHFQDELY